MDEAQDYYDQAIKADQKNKSKAFDLFFKAAHMKHLDAQYMMGVLCIESNAQDKYFEAYDWWVKAARNGHAKAQYNLAICHTSGKGAERDPQLALRWYEKAAEQGHLGAQFTLARQLYQGLSVNRDFQKAYHWMERAAQNGHVNAMGDIALMCAMGQGSDAPNKIKGYAWALLAKDHNFPKADHILDSIRNSFQISRRDAEFARDLIKSKQL